MYRITGARLDASEQILRSKRDATIKYWQNLNSQPSQAWLIYAGDQQQKRRHANIIGWENLPQLIETL